MNQIIYYVKIKIFQLALQKYLRFVPYRQGPGLNSIDDSFLLL